MKTIRNVWWTLYLTIGVFGLRPLQSQQLQPQTGRLESNLAANRQLFTPEEIHPLKVYVDGDAEWAATLKRRLKDLEVVVTEGVTAANCDVRLRRRGDKLILERHLNLNPTQLVIVTEIRDLESQLPLQLSAEWRWQFLRELKVNDSQAPLKVEMRVVKLGQKTNENAQDETDPQSAENGRIILHEGDRFRVEVRNLSQEPAFVCGLCLSSSGQIQEIVSEEDRGMPAEDGRFRIWRAVSRGSQWTPSATYVASKPFGVDVLRFVVSRQPFDLNRFLFADPLSAAVLANKTGQSPLWTTHAVEVETRAKDGEPVDTNLPVERPPLEGLAITRGVDNSRTGVVLNSLGGIYQALRHDDKALRLYEEAVGQFREERNKSGEATALINLGLTHEALGKHVQALNDFTLALRLRRELKDRVGEIEVLNNLASTCRALSRHELAIQYCNQALRVARTLQDKELEANTLNILGFTYYSLSNYAAALNNYRQALNLVRRINTRVSQTLEAAVLNNLGLTYSALSRYDEAIPIYEQALTLKRALRDDVSVGVTLNNLGGIFTATSRPAKAIEYYQQALVSARSRGDRGSEGIILNNLGGAYTSLHQYDSALSYCQQALTLVREVKNRAAEGAILHDIGQIYRFMNRYVEATRYYEQALPIRREVKDLAGEGFTLNNLMFAVAALHKPSEAIFYGKQAINTYQQIRGVIQSLDKSSQQSFLFARKGTYETLSALLIEAGRLPEAEQVSRMLKQTETFDFVRRDATQIGVTESLSLTPLEKDYIARYEKLGLDATTVGDRIAVLEKLPEEDLTSQQKTELEELYKDREVIDGRFEVFRKQLVAAFGGVTPDIQTVDVAASDAWQKALAKVSSETKKRTALLTTVVAPETFYVILTTSTTRLRFSKTIKSGDVNTLVDHFRSCLKNPRVNPQADAQALWKIIFCDGKLEQALQSAHIQVALWSLSGSLRYVPIDALHDGVSYLVARNRLNVVMTTTSKDYFDAPQNGKALGVGTSHAFNVKLPDGTGGVDTMVFSALSKVPDEVRGIIHDKADGGTGPLDGHILLDSDFNESALQAQLRRHFATVHIATHFRLQPGDAQRSFLLLGDGSPLRVFDWKVKMPLKNVELLTLSACETGLGGDTPKEGASSTTTITGAEVGSLGEVAQLQGAAAVVVSLWSVADSSTSLLMRDFYAQWRQNPAAGKAEALRKAQRKLLGVTSSQQADGQRGAPRLMTSKSANGAQPFVADSAHRFSHPFYWAPFILIGNWR